jgi:hypothetical protein
MNKLLFLAAKARKEESWLDFSRFCELRGQGVRAAAMEELGKFLKANASDLLPLAVAAQPGISRCPGPTSPSHP